MVLTILLIIFFFIFFGVRVISISGNKILGELIFVFILIPIIVIIPISFVFFS